ncbi:MAG: helix-turn-helix domain-containing protein [Thermoanaerobaculia bacterium]
MKTLLSPRDLAEAIGVSESSIKRWVDDGVIQAAKTAGGHRRIATPEAVRFIRESRSVVVRPDLLGFREVAALKGELPAAGDEAKRLFDYLRAGAAPEAHGLLLSLYLGGQSVAEIVDGPLQSAMEWLGELWTKEEPGIFWEHRATEIAIRSMANIRSLFSPPDDALLAVGGAPAGDPYSLPTISAAAVLESVGWRAVNLGPDTPIESLLLAVESLRPQLVWLSVSVVAEPEALRQGVERLILGLSKQSLSLVLGGSASDQLDLGPQSLLHVGERMSELEAFAKGLALASEAGPREIENAG